MSPEDEDLRTLFLARARRSGRADIDRMIERAMAPEASRVHGTVRSPVAGLGRLSMSLLVVGVLTALGIGAVLQPGGRTLPTGLWQSDVPVGTGTVGANTCVALDLDDAAYDTGEVTLWWWAPDEGESDCRTSSSGPMEARAVLGPADLGARDAFRVRLDLELIGSGSERIEFVLDPYGPAAAATGLAGFAGSAAQGRALSFARVQALDVSTPGGVPAPTPWIDGAP